MKIYSVEPFIIWFTLKEIKSLKLSKTIKNTNNNQFLMKFSLKFIQNPLKKIFKNFKIRRTLYIIFYFLSDEIE